MRRRRAATGQPAIEGILFSTIVVLASSWDTVPGVISWLCIVIAANRDARNVLVINSGNFSAAHVRQLDKTSERSGTLRSIYSCAWMVFVALLLDY